MSSHPVSGQLTYLSNVALAAGRQPNHDDTYLGVLDLYADSIVSPGRHLECVQSLEIRAMREQQALAGKANHSTLLQGNANVVQSELACSLPNSGASKDGQTDRLGWCKCRRQIESRC